MSTRQTRSARSKQRKGAYLLLRCMSDEFSISMLRQLQEAWDMGYDMGFRHSTEITEEAFAAADKRANRKRLRVVTS